VYYQAVQGTATTQLRRLVEAAATTYPDIRAVKEEWEPLLTHLVDRVLNRLESFCCSGLWVDFDEDPKPSEERLREALQDTDTGGAVVKFVVACPMCMTMHEDGRKTGATKMISASSGLPNSSRKRCSPEKFKRVTRLIFNGYL
jgi:hypothetical protein